MSTKIHTRALEVLRRWFQTPGVTPTPEDARVITEWIPHFEPLANLIEDRAETIGSLRRVTPQQEARELAIIRKRWKTYIGTHPGEKISQQAVLRWLRIVEPRIPERRRIRYVRICARESLR